MVTTKQERFVKHILKANGIQLADENIFGLDHNMGKAKCWHGCSSQGATKDEATSNIKEAFGLCLEV